MLLPKLLPIEANQIMYDGVNLSHYFDVLQVKIQPFPPVTLNSVQVSGRAGSYFASVDYGERTIVLTLLLKGYYRDYYHVSRRWREYMPLLFKDEPKPLQLDESKTIYAIATQASDIERVGEFGRVEVTFTANDPYFYGKEHKLDLETGENTYYLTGNTQIFPNFEITGASGELVILNTDTGEKIRIVNVLSPDAKVTINTEKSRCEINGSHLAVDLSQTDFFSLSPGLIHINLSKGNGFMTYREREL